MLFFKLGTILFNYRSKDININLHIRIYICKLGQSQRKGHLYTFCIRIFSFKKKGLKLFIERYFRKRGKERVWGRICSFCINKNRRCFTKPENPANKGNTSSDKKEIQAQFHRGYAFPEPCPSLPSSQPHVMGLSLMATRAPEETGAGKSHVLFRVSSSFSCFCLQQKT